jgi:hypothetical protein
MWLEQTNQPSGVVATTRPLFVKNVVSSIRYRLGNLVEIQDCPAAVSRNESRKQTHWLAPNELGSGGK